MHAVQSRSELLLIGRRSGRIVGRRRVVIDLAERNSVAAPSALKAAVIAVSQDALGVHNVNLFRVFIEIEKEDAAREHVGVLIIFGEPRGWRTRRAMSEIPQQLAVGRALLN